MAANNIQFTKIEIQIAKHLFKHYKDSYNARQLAKILNINHAHTNKLCNLLVSKNLLKKAELGNAIYFSFDYENKLAIKFMEYMLSLEEKDFPKWLVVILHSLKKFEQYIKLGLVFGSSTKNKEFNDIDVLLVYDSNKANEIKKIKEEIRKSGLIEKPIRYMDIAERDISLNKEDKIFYSIISDNLIFYNPEKYVEVLRNLRKISGTIKKGF
jgi:predicted nucleotidyltransferase